jgi:hypothetical protein
MKDGSDGPWPALGRRNELDSQAPNSKSAPAARIAAMHGGRVLTIGKTP